MCFVVGRSRLAIILSQRSFQRLFLFIRSSSTIGVGGGKIVQSCSWGRTGLRSEGIYPFSSRLGAVRYFKHIDFDQFAPDALEEKPKKRVYSYTEKRELRKEKEMRLEKKLRLQEEERLKYKFYFDKWELMIRDLQDLEKYPVGFTNTAETAVVASWCQQTSLVLQQTLSLNAANSLEPALQLLDRLFQEEQAHDPSLGGIQVLSSPDISSLAIESVFKSWKMSLLYPPFYEKMDEESLRRAQDRITFYGNFLAKHEDSMIGQVSKLLDPGRIFTKTMSTDRLLWTHIPHTRHPNAEDETKKKYYEIDFGKADDDDDDEFINDEDDGSSR
jgi:hypothetical protein